ncbi:MAG: hypothetical protein K6A89_02605 [Treponema sp.]|nr:hypothetical protein [Treponema sp.]
MAVWREIWQESIASGRQTLLQNDQKGKIFEELKQKYPDDAMVVFEEAITFDCMKNYKRAIELYKEAYNRLPVDHWKENANYLLQKAIIKNSNIKIPKLTRDDVVKIDSGELIENDFKLFGYFYMHSYCYIPDNIRNLAISSISRIDTEASMAIAIFRTCVEVSLKDLFATDYNFTDDDNLQTVIETLDHDGRIDDMAKTFYKLKEKGNQAVHQAKTFLPKEVSRVIVNFDKAMEYFNYKFKELYKANK